MKSTPLTTPAVSIEAMPPINRNADPTVVASASPGTAHLFVGLVLVAAAALVASGCQPSSGQSPNGPAAGAMSPPTVSVANVEQREMVLQDTFSAKLDAVESVELRPRASGYLTAVRFEAGQLVKTGDILFQINPKPAETAVRTAEAALMRAQVAAEVAVKEAARAERLLTDKTISPEEADTRRWKEADTQAALRGAEAALNSARIQLGYCDVRSPINGRVGRALVTVGNNVSGVDGFTTLLANVVSVDPIYAYAAVDEAAWLRFKKLELEGQLPKSPDGKIAVEVSLADDPTTVFPGVIDHFDNRIDPTSGSILLRSVIPNHDGRLIPGLFSRVRIPSSGRAPVLLVDEAAVGTEQNLKYVYTLSTSNTVQKTFVTMGGSVEGKRIVRSGLKPSDRIVVNGLQRILFPGMPVTIQN